MLGQRVSNEQSNVGPTKYVAVGPTLNQRLGFGWRMVSMLAGLLLHLFILSHFPAPGKLILLQPGCINAMRVNYMCKRAKDVEYSEY